MTGKDATHPSILHVKRKYTEAYSAIKTVLAAKERAIEQQFMYKEYPRKWQQMKNHCRRKAIFVYVFRPNTNIEKTFPISSLCIVPSKKFSLKCNPLT